MMHMVRVVDGMVMVGIARQVREVRSGAAVGKDGSPTQDVRHAGVHPGWWVKLAVGVPRAWRMSRIRCAKHHALELASVLV